MGTTKQKLIDYAEEFSFSGIAHLLGFGLTSTMLAIAGTPNAVMAGLALSGISFLGHGAARGAKELYEFLSNDGKKLKLSNKANENIKYFLQAGIYTIFASLAIFAYIAAIGASLPLAGGIAGIIGVALLTALTLAKFAPEMWQGFCDLVGWKTSNEQSNKKNEFAPDLTQKEALDPTNYPKTPLSEKDPIESKNEKQELIDSSEKTSLKDLLDTDSNRQPIPRDLLNRSNNLLNLYFEGKKGGQVPRGLQKAFDSRFGLTAIPAQSFAQPATRLNQSALSNSEQVSSENETNDNDWVLC